MSMDWIILHPGTTVGVQGRFRCPAHAHVGRREATVIPARRWGLREISSRRTRLAAFQPRNTYPEPETEKERSPVDFPQEWITPQPSRRPDVQPEFEKLETPPPKKMPGDPELPDDEEEEEEKKKKEPNEDPDKEKPDEPPSEE